MKFLTFVLMSSVAFTQATQVIMLMGPSCAGKSTLAQYAQEHLDKNKDWAVVDFDDVGENIEQLIAQTNNYLCRNINVIIDTNTYEYEMEKKIKGATSITKVLITAPLTILLERDDRRTIDLQRTEKRAIVCRNFVINSFNRSNTWSSNLLIDSSELSIDESFNRICTKIEKL